jgi:hypothetical protein
MSDLKLTNSILNILEGLCWLALAGSAIRAIEFFDTLPTQLAISATIRNALLCLGAIAFARTAKAIVMIAENTASSARSNQATSRAVLGNPAPSGYAGDHKVGQVAKVYKGVEITWTQTGVKAANCDYSSILIAEKAIDAMRR